MKNLLIILAVVLGVGAGHTVQAQKKPKVLDKSQKKQPAWVNGLESGYIITVASSSGLEDAQQKALAKVKEQIISSVAENIQSESEYFRSEVIKDNDATFAESMKTATKTRAADIPFIKGISLSKVDEYYWEKVSDNSGTKYYYHIKYPFSRIDLQKLIREYEKMDQELTDRLEAAILKVDETNSVEEYNKIIKELQALEEGFIDVDPRKNKAQAAIATTSQMMRDISIETVSTTLGEIRVRLVNGEKTVVTTRKPTVKSNCARIVEVKSKSPEWVISYTYDECYDDPGNKIFVEFKNPYGKANQEFFFNVNDEKIAIFVNNDINFTSDKIVIPITSKYGSPFVIEKVIFNFGKEAPLIYEGLNQKFEGEGKHELSLPTGDIDQAVYAAGKYNMIKGTIHYKSVKTGEGSIYKMYNQKITTAW